jgi:hypothetical protein
MQYIAAKLMQANVKNKKKPFKNLNMKITC